MATAMLVRPFAAEHYGQPIPTHWIEQPEIVEACGYDGQLDEEALVRQQQLEARFEARTQAVAGFITEALATSRFCDEVVIALIRSKTIGSIIGKARRKPDAMYDVHALQIVTNEEDTRVGKGVLEDLRDATGTPSHRPNGKPAVTLLGNPYSGDGFSGQQAKLVTLGDDGLVLAEVQAYTPREYVRYWETRPFFEANRGYGPRPPHVEGSGSHRSAAFHNLATAGITAFFTD